MPGVNETDSNQHKPSAVALWLECCPFNTISHLKFPTAAAVAFKEAKIAVKTSIAVHVMDHR